MGGRLDKDQAVIDRELGSREATSSQNGSNLSQRGAEGQRARKEALDSKEEYLINSGQ
jgi:hypothetical protein